MQIQQQIMLELADIPADRLMGFYEFITSCGKSMDNLHRFPCISRLIKQQPPELVSLDAVFVYIIQQRDPYSCSNLHHLR